MSIGVYNELPRASKGVQYWRELYLAALTEADLQKLPFRIIAAERALYVRTLELLATSKQSSPEIEALDNCLEALCVLRESVTRSPLIRAGEAVVGTGIAREKQPSRS
jgi:hypothetical protein